MDNIKGVPLQIVQLCQRYVLKWKNISNIIPHHTKIVVTRCLNFIRYLRSIRYIQKTFSLALISKTVKFPFFENENLQSKVTLNSMNFNRFLTQKMTKKCFQCRKTINICKMQSIIAGQMIVRWLQIYGFFTVLLVGFTAWETFFQIQLIGTWN